MEQPGPDFIPMMVCAKPWGHQASVDHGEKQTMLESPKLGYNRKPYSRGPAEGLLAVHHGKNGSQTTAKRIARKLAYWIQGTEMSTQLLRIHPLHNSWMVLILCIHFMTQSIFLVSMNNFIFNMPWIEMKAQQVPTKQVEKC